MAAQPPAKGFFDSFVGWLLITGDKVKINKKPYLWFLIFVTLLLSGYGQNIFQSTTLYTPNPEPSPTFLVPTQTSQQEILSSSDSCKKNNLRYYQR
jgi:hypothetical protein